MIDVFGPEPFTPALAEVGFELEDPFGHTSGKEIPDSRTVLRGFFDIEIKKGKRTGIVKDREGAAAIKTEGLH
jgi:hypothetical protein